MRPLAGREWIIPSLSNFAQSERVLRPVDGASLGDPALSLTQAQVDVLVSRPLSALPLDRYVAFLSRAERELKDVSAQLPFDVSRHPQAQSEVARAMTDRLQSDMRTFAAQENTGKTAKLLHLLDADVAAIIADPALAHPHLCYLSHSGLVGVAAAAARRRLRPTCPTPSPSSSHRPTRSPLTPPPPSPTPTPPPPSIASVSSSAATPGRRVTCGWRPSSPPSCPAPAPPTCRRSTPTSTPGAIAAIFDVAVAVILRANRVGHANRSISDARDLLHLLHQAQHPTPDTTQAALTAGLSQKAEMLARNLVTARHYIDRVERPEGSELVYDPRFLVFEFTWNLCLRKMQVELVRDFMQHVARGQSMVKGMLMGEGKTTVVGPLLALMLADGKRLVVQCCPPALLEFSRSIQRSTFSSIMYKVGHSLTSTHRSSRSPSHLLSLLLSCALPSV